jgi:ribosomal protein S18 acetylase RimI-like enzyme
VVKGRLTLLRVEKEAAPEVLDITRDAALWLERRGMNQWRTFLDPEKAQLVIAKRFEEGEVFLAYLDGKAVATITLQWKDGFWGELGQDPDAGYIHTMALRREHAGRGLGPELLDWAGGYFGNAGKTKTRLDCIEENTRLCQFYDALGFKTIGRKEWDGEHLVMKERRQA